MRFFSSLTFNYQVTKMDSWHNIIISKNDPEIIEINKLENEFEVVSTSVKAVRQLITKFEICHFKYTIHYDYILRSIEFLSPFVDPDSIGSSHPRKGPDSWKKNKTGHSRTAQIYIDALQLWLNPKSLTVFDSHIRVIQIMEAHITELLNERNNEKEKLVELLIKRLLWRPMDRLQDQIERTDICHYTFPDNIERVLAGIGSLAPAEDFQGCGSYNSKIKREVSVWFLQLCMWINGEPGYLDRVLGKRNNAKIWLATCLAKTLKEQVSLINKLPLQK
jgi:hypothetical protein